MLVITSKSVKHGSLLHHFIIALIPQGMIIAGLLVCGDFVLSYRNFRIETPPTARKTSSLKATKKRQKFSLPKSLVFYLRYRNMFPKRAEDLFMSYVRGEKSFTQTYIYYRDFELSTEWAAESLTSVSGWTPKPAILVFFSMLSNSILNNEFFKADIANKFELRAVRVTVLLCMCRCDSLALMETGSPNVFGENSLWRLNGLHNPTISVDTNVYWSHLILFFLFCFVLFFVDTM